MRSCIDNVHREIPIYRTVKSLTKKIRSFRRVQTQTEILEINGLRTVNEMIKTIIHKGLVGGRHATNPLAWRKSIFLIAHLG